MNESDETRNHSVILDEEACKGCTICVTSCPAEAIRVRNGKARIQEERCIDCGECIRRCPHHAKKARVDDITKLTDSAGLKKFDYTIALPAPSLYGQFPERYSIGDIHTALCNLGFDEVFPVAAATAQIARSIRSVLDREQYPELPRPLISSSCPTIIKFIQICFPTLLGHIVPVIAPMELAGRIAKKRATDKFVYIGQKKIPNIGVFFISPCPGKITEARAPLGNEPSSVDGVFSQKDIHLPLLASLSKIESCFRSSETESEEIAWGHAGGEAEATIADTKYTYLAVDGIDQCRKILESIEEGKLDTIDFLELMACTGGCVGGPLAVTNPILARHTIQIREKILAGEPTTKSDKTYTLIEKRTVSQNEAGSQNCFRTAHIPARPALLLDNDYQKAMYMMNMMEEIYEGLPGLDCGCCGAPNCHALAEDIVRGNASRTDCVIILKEQYRNLLESGPLTKK